MFILRKQKWHRYNSIKAHLKPTVIIDLECLIYRVWNPLNSYYFHKGIHREDYLVREPMTLLTYGDTCWWWLRYKRVLRKVCCVYPAVGAASLHSSWIPVMRHSNVDWNEVAPWECSKPSSPLELLNRNYIIDSQYHGCTVIVQLFSMYHESLSINTLNNTVKTQSNVRIWICITTINK